MAGGLAIAAKAGTLKREAEPGQEVPGVKRRRVHLAPQPEVRHFKVPQLRAGEAAGLREERQRHASIGVAMSMSMQAEPEEEVADVIMPDIYSVIEDTKDDIMRSCPPCTSRTA